MLSTVADRYTITSPTREYAAATDIKAGTYTSSTPQRTAQTFEDPMLGVMVEEARVREQKVTCWRRLRPRRPATKPWPGSWSRRRWSWAARWKTPRDLVESGAEVALGNEAYVAVEQISAG